MSDDKKRYNYMENVLQEINRKFISLNDNEVKRNNKILESLLTTIVNKMKEQDLLFKDMFQRVFYGGSYYDGLKVGRPEEFDLDLLMKLPKFAEPHLTTSNCPGFVNLQLKKYDAWIRQPEAMPAYRTFGNLFDEDYYLDTNKVLSWIEGIITKTLNGFPKNRSGNYVISNGNGDFEVKSVKGGPAHTLKISGSGVEMDVDLVACFVFRADKWPSAEFKPNPVKSKPEFFIVPKKPKASSGKVTRYWRLSFQEQERALMDSKLCLKPTIKLLKKLRDKENHCKVASYYIKTATLHICDSKSEDFWRNSLSYCFMSVLKEYQKFIERGNIPYYWNKNNNLFNGVNAATLQNIASRLNLIILDIERRPTEPRTVSKYLLTDKEQLEFGVSALNL